MLKKAFYAGLAFAPLAMLKAQEVTLPDVGQDTLSDYVTLGITSIAGVVAVVIGGYVGFKVIKAGLGWVRSAFK